ncbi:MAG: FKBP-type peptidyl-prolyl cis-trans isomerase, partial [Lachnospiraceae bacterium]
MKKKLATLLLSVCVVATVTGCGSKEISDKNITISQYKGVEVDKVAEGKVTKEDVENSIKSTQEANVITNEVKDRAVQDGDTATIDFVGKKDGVEFEGGSAKDYPLTVGASNFIEGFDTGLIGHNAGETFDLPLTFPAEYQVADLAGKDVVFTTT